MIMELIQGVKISKKVYEKEVDDFLLELEKKTGDANESVVNNALEEKAKKNAKFLNDLVFAVTEDTDFIVLGEKMLFEKDLSEIKPIEATKAKKIAEVSAEFFGTRNNWREVKTYIVLA